MSAIGGILHLNGKPVSRPVLHQMSEAVKHRGPDRQNLWHEGSIGLLNNLLITTPEANYELMPLKFHDYVITADARIDNRDELISKLSINPPYNKLTDSELILRSYIKWKENCPKQLLGDFAFAIWDDKNKELFCARDQFGVKPINYYFDKNIFIFSSEIKALFTEKSIPKLLNEERIADYIVQDLEGIDNASTFFKSIYKLAPATSVTVKKKGIKFKKYWQLDPTKPIKYKNDEEYLEGFKEKFTTAVNRRLRRSRNIGVTLSGGVDSSSIVVIANQLIDKNNLQIISATLNNDNDKLEKPYIEDVLNHTNLRNKYITENYILDQKDIFSDFLNNVDDLFDTQMNLIIPLCIFAQNNNINILNFGTGADSVTSERISSTTYLLNDLKFLNTFKEFYGYSKINDIALHKLLWQFAFKPFIPKPAKFLYKKLFQDKNPQEPNIDNEILINRNFASRVNLIDRYRTMSFKEETYKNKQIPEFVQKHYNLLNQSFINVAIDRYDRVSSKCGIEARHPFLDIELMQYCLNLPLEQKIDWGINKAIVRNSLKEYLPSKIVNKTDSYHLGPYYQNVYLQIFDDEIRSIIENSSEFIDGFINIDSLNSLYNHNKAYNDFEDYGYYIWIAFTLNLWIKNNF